MSTEVGSAFVSILPSAKGFGTNLGKIVDGESDKSGRRGGRTFGTAFARTSAGPIRAGFGTIGKAATGIFAGLAIGKGLKDTVTAASDLSESANKVNVVFKRQGPIIQKASETSARAMGLSSQAYLESTGTLGNLLVSLNIAPKKAAGLSQSMVKLAGDLASFNNVSPEEALLALRSGLTGETEPLKKFGVNMNEATLRAQALKLGLVKNVKEALTPHNKALAASALIMEQTKTAQGDFARTSGGLANQQRILAAQVVDLKAKIGKALLPVVTQAVQGFNAFTESVQSGKSKGEGFAGFMSRLGVTVRDEVIPRLTQFRDFVVAEVLPRLAELGQTLKTSVLPAVMSLGTTVTSTVLPAIGPMATLLGTIVTFIGGLPGPMQLAALAFIAAGRGASSAAPGISSFATKLKAAKTEGGLLKSGLGGLMGIFGGPWGLALAGGVAVLAGFAAKHAEAKVRVDELARSLDTATGAITRETRASVSNTLEKSGALVAAQKLGISLKDLTSAALGNDGAQRRVNTALAEYRKTLPEATGKTGAHTGANVQLSAAEREVAANVAKVSGAVNGTSKEMEAARAKAARLRDALGGLGGQARIAGRDFVDGLTKSIQAGTGAAVAAAQGLANKTAAALNSRGGFDNGSPSKKGIQSGKWLIEGVAIGMKNATITALNAAKDMADKISTHLQDRLSKAVDRLSTLRDKAKAAFDTGAGGVAGFLDISQIGQSIETQVTKSIIDPITGVVSAVTTAVSSVPSAASLFTGFATSAKAFAAALATMAQKKFPLSLITAIAGSGNLSAAQALASLSPGDTASVKSSLGEINTAASQAGGLLRGLTVDPKVLKAATDAVIADRQMVALLDKIDKKLGALDKDDHVEVKVRGDDLVVMIDRIHKQNARKK